MYCFLLRIRFTLSTQVKPSQSFADGFWTHSKYSLLTCVVNYPAVANALIMKLNCTTVSSAAVERLFSASAQVLTARRCRMQDETLDKHICLRHIDHSQALKHDVDIPDRSWSRLLVAVDRRNVTDWLC